MLQDFDRRGLILGMCLSCVLLVFACSPPADKDVAKQETENVIAEVNQIKDKVEDTVNELNKSASTVTLAAQLAAADLLDGAEDQTVHKCAGCALGMDGKAEHGLDFEDYTLHFCSAFCLKGFSEDTESKVLALSIP